MKIAFRLTSPHATIPAQATPGSAGADIRACLEEDVHVFPGDRQAIPTGFCMAIPRGYEAQIRPRSGLALAGIKVANSPGTIDSDYRNEVKVIIENSGDSPFRIKHGDRIAQMIVSKYESYDYVLLDSLDETERKGGFGHTGIE